MYRRKLGRVLICFSLILLYLLSIEPVSDALLRPLESQALPLHTRDIAVEGQAIILLGGGIYEQSPEYAGRDALPPVVLMRTTYAAYLATTAHVPVYATGGHPLHPQSRPEGVIMRDWLIRLGVPVERVRVETTANTTCESALRLAPILLKDGIRNIILVTSALHMPRAMFCFSGLDIEVTPAPCAYLGKRGPYDLLSFLPRANILAISSDALWEYLGMLWYRVYYSGRHNRALPATIKS